MTKNAYADALTMAMGDDITLRDLERAMGEFSYEHIRAVVRGDNVLFSREFNNAICKALHLDADRMWNLINRLRAERKFGKLSPVVAPPDSRMKTLWEDLTAAQKTRLCQIAQSMVESNKAMSDDFAHAI